MTFADLWNHVLFRVGGDEITVRSVALALVLLVLGYFVARAVARIVARLLAHRLGLEAGASNAIETLGFYLLYVTAAFTSLNLVNFPLTIFTIAGGAVAIGIGFGSQNVMNNFISGLILHLERPVRVGDLLEFGGTYGVVERIGPRSTVVRGTDNTQVIVPNSFFLQNNVVNFTLSDDVVRTIVRVGVAYGSPTRAVEAVLRRCLDEHPRVLDHPPPRVLFTDFGDSALLFEALFWVRSRTMIERRTVESDLRYRIDELFREAGIVIAFPQRDVHLDARRPLDVRLVGPAPGGDRS